MFTKTYKITALVDGELITEEYTGNYFQMSSRVTAVRNLGAVIQSVTKN